MKNLIDSMTSAQLIGTNFDHEAAIKYATKVLRQRNRNAFESRKDLN